MPPFLSMDRLIRLRDIPNNLGIKPDLYIRDSSYVVSSKFGFHTNLTQGYFFNFDLLFPFDSHKSVNGFNVYGIKKWKT